MIITLQDSLLVSTLNNRLSSSQSKLNSEFKQSSLFQQNKVNRFFLELVKQNKFMHKKKQENIMTQLERNT